MLFIEKIGLELRLRFYLLLNPQTGTRSSNAESPISLDGSPNIDLECSVSKQLADSEKSNGLIFSPRNDEQTNSTVLNGREEEGMCNGLMHVCMPEMTVSYLGSTKETQEP